MLVSVGVPLAAAIASLVARVAAGSGHVAHALRRRDGGIRTRIESRATVNKIGRSIVCRLLLLAVALLFARLQWSVATFAWGPDIGLRPVFHLLFCLTWGMLEGRLFAARLSPLEPSRLVLWLELVVLIAAATFVGTFFSRILDDLLPGDSDLLVRNLRETPLNGCNEVLFLLASGETEGLLDDEVAELVLDESGEPRRVRDFADQGRASLGVCALEAPLNHVRRKLLHAQLDDLVLQLIEDWLHDRGVPFVHDLADCIVTVGVGHELKQVVRNLGDHPPPLPLRRSQLDHDFYHAEAVLVETQQEQIGVDLLEDGSEEVVVRASGFEDFADDVGALLVDGEVVDVVS